MISKTMKVKSSFLKYYNEASLRNKLIYLNSVLVSLLIFVLGILFSSIYRNSIITYEKGIILQNMHQINNAVDSFFEAYMNKSEMVYNNIEFQHILNRKNKSLADKINDSNTIVNILNPVTSDTKLPEIKSSYFFGGNVRLEVYIIESEQPLGGILRSCDEVLFDAWYKNIIESKARFGWNHYPVYNGEHVIALSRRLMDFDSGKFMGAFRILVPAKRLENILIMSKLAEGNTLYYIDEDNNIIATSGVQLDISTSIFASMSIEEKSNNSIYLVSINSDNYLVGSIKSNICGYRLVFFTPLSIISQKTQSITIMTLVFIFLAVTISVIMARFLSGSISKRVDVLVAMTQKITAGDFSKYENNIGSDELGQLEKNINQMSSKLLDFINREYLSQLVVNRIKYELLQEQINPHLLYNTLSFFSYSAKITANKELSKLADNLIVFYKAALNRGEIVSTLNDEIEIIKSYISITIAVYELNIRVIFDIDPTLLSYCIIKLILQPVVENAIIHGIKPNKCGVLTIRCKQESENLILSVEDDGVGLDKNAKDVFDKIISGAMYEQGYGIGNVINRIHLFFGKEYGLCIDSSPWDGTRVQITIPKLNRREIDELLQNKKIVL